MRETILDDNLDMCLRARRAIEREHKDFEGLWRFLMKIEKMPRAQFLKEARRLALGPHGRTVKPREPRGLRQLQAKAARMARTAARMAETVSREKSECSARKRTALPVFDSGVRRPAGFNLVSHIRDKEARYGAKRTPKRPTQKSK